MDPLPTTTVPAKKTDIRLLVGVLAVLLLGAGGYWYYAVSVRPTNVPARTPGQTPFAALLVNNQYFAEANAAADAGNYAKAKSLYAQALSLETDPVQRGQIEYKMALLEDQYGDPIQAVRLYKNIVANSQYDSYKLVKAYAVMSMVELFYRTGDPAITSEIFKDAPYNTMVADTSGLSYRHVEEYAISFYPLAIPELRVASWYAANLNKPSPDGTATSTYPAIIQNAIKLADANIERTKSDTNAAKLIPSASVREASVYVNMYESGLASAADTEAACKEAVSIYTATGYVQNDGFARYYYAIFLSDQGASRVADLKAILAPLSSEVYKQSTVLAFFKSERSNRLQQKARLVKIALLDPEFKQLLISLGWSAADF